MIFSSDETSEYDSDETNDDGNVLYQYPIHEAVFEGDCEKILSLLAEGHNVNFVNDNAETPVHVAVFNKQYSALKLLLSHDAQPVYEGVYCNPLVYATSEVDEECVQILLDYDSDPSYQDDSLDNLWTPLHEACHRGLTAILEKFINTNCDLDVKNEGGATPVYTSCQYGQKECLQMLLIHGADPEIAVDFGDTPLHMACQEGNYDCVAALLNYDINIDCYNDTGETPLAVACLHDRYECAKLLLENHASQTAKYSNAHKLPIHLAAHHSSVACLRLLIENGADVNSVCMGCTPLYEAASADNLPACKLLLSQGADTRFVCEIFMLRKTALMAAACNGNVEIIQELVSHGADVSQATFTSPLMLAAKFKHCGALRQLLSYNPEINYVDEGGNSLLSTLCTVIVANYSTDEYEDLLQCCREVLTSGADISHLAKVSKHSPIMDSVLMRMCADLIRLLMEFSTCREHVQFLTQICETYMSIDERLEDWERLYNFIWQPRKLVHLCRIKIRCVIGRKRLGMIKELHLPEILKDYLQHKEEMTFD